MKILIVDDQESILTSVRRTLKYKGFDEVEICSESRKALALIQEQNFRCGLVGYHDAGNGWAGNP